MILEYIPSGNLKISSVKLFIKDHMKSPVEMTKVEDIWVADLPFSKGKYLYRFVINEQFTLCDPTANFYQIDNEDVMWSVLMCSDKGQRLYNTEQYYVNIDNYTISNCIIDQKSNYFPRKKMFNSLIDSIVSVRFDFSHVTGLHSVTLLWVDPKGDILDYTENHLFPTDDLWNPTISIWFNLDLHNKNYYYSLGSWKFLLFIDGEYIMEDYFQLGQATIYTNNARMSICN